VIRERFVDGEAEAAAAGRDGEIVAGGKKFCAVAGVQAHAEEHGYGFVDGSGRKLSEPGIADAPGREGSDGKRKPWWEFAADVPKESGVKGMGARRGIKVDLDGRNAGDGLHTGDFRDEESALR